VDTLYARSNILSLWVAADMAEIATGTIAIEDLCFNGIMRSLQFCEWWETREGDAALWTNATRRHEY
jgi:hypothetical protein